MVNQYAAERLDWIAPAIGANNALGDRVPPTLGKKQYAALRPDWIAPQSELVPQWREARASRSTHISEIAPEIDHRALPVSTAIANHSVTLLLLC